MSTLTPAHSPAPRRHLRRIAVALVLCFAAVSLTGCLRAQVSLAISASDRVSGQIVIAIPQDSGISAPTLKAPAELGGKVRVDAYEQDGYVGSRVFFTDLTFAEAGQLNQLDEGASGLVDLELHRGGDQVTLEAKADLRRLPSEGSDVAFKVAFPGHVGNTNGVRESDEIVSWNLPGGEITTMRADVRYSDPKNRGFMGWVGIVFGIAIAVALGVGAMAYVYRNPAPRGVGADGTRQQNFLTEVTELRDRFTSTEAYRNVKSWIDDRRGAKRK